MQWGNALIKHIRGIQVTQKICVRVICGANFKSPSSPIFKQLGILKFQDIYELHTNVFIYSFVNGVYQIPSWVYTGITEIYMNIILDRALTPEHQMPIPIS